MSRSLIDVGFYGKLPCRGDFLQRRAPQDFVDAWDVWLQEGLHASRERLRDAWLETYLTGPVWRFVLTAGICGEHAYAGILVPSVDRVGRYFPLTVIAQLPENDCLLAVACGSTQWFDAAESLVLEALQAEALDFDAFDDHVALLRERIDTVAMDDAALAKSAFSDARFPAESPRWRMSLTSAASLQSAMNAYAWGELIRSQRMLALWWTQGSAAVAPSWLCTTGLPAPDAFAAMLSGDWAGSDWTTLGGGH